MTDESWSIAEGRFYDDIDSIIDKFIKKLKFHVLYEEVQL